MILDPIPHIWTNFICLPHWTWLDTVLFLQLNHLQQWAGLVGFFAYLVYFLPLDGVNLSPLIMHFWFCPCSYRMPQGSVIVLCFNILHVPPGKYSSLLWSRLSLTWRRQIYFSDLLLGLHFKHIWPRSISGCQKILLSVGWIWVKYCSFPIYIFVEAFSFWRTSQLFLTPG